VGRIAHTSGAARYATVYAEYVALSFCTMNNDTLPWLAAYKLPAPVIPFVLAGAGTRNETIGIHSGAGDFVWKTYRSHAGIEGLLYEHRLLIWLAAQPLSFAVPAPVSTVDGGTLCGTPDGYGALFPCLPGRRPNTTCVQQIEAVGAGLGELHATLMHCPLGQRPELPGYGALANIHPDLSDPFHMTPEMSGLPATKHLKDLFAWWRKELAALHHFIETTYEKLPYQMIHGDYGPGNTLYAAGGLAAIIDFELALIDIRAMDVAAGLFFCMRHWENTDPLALLDAFGRGYAHWVHLAPAELQALPWLMRLRNAVSTLWRMGRALAMGAPPPLDRMEEMRASAHWLAMHEEQLRIRAIGAFACRSQDSRE
jgi:Ser/Thr protein kinase RdoA (MazF antagonist)